MMSRPTHKPRTGLIAALDVGTAKTCCLIARVESDGPRVVGVGYHASRGLRAGAVTDMEACEKSILQAVHQAEQMAGETIRSVIVNLSGGQPFSRTASFDIAIGGREIGDADLRKVLDHAFHKLGGSRGGEPADRTVLHTEPVGYTVDGSTGIRDPRGMVGQRLGVNLHVVTAALAAERNLRACIARCHLDVDELVISPYAAGLSALVDDERDLGVTLVDMGAGTTTIAVFNRGHAVFTDCVPLGGQHITSDIARGLSTPLAHAERMKTLYGSAVAADIDERDMIDVPLVGEEDQVQANHVPRSILIGIIQPRAEETFELVRSRLEAAGFDQAAGRRVVLTGGAAQLAGARELAAHILDKQVRVGRPLRVGGLTDSTCGPAFACAAGLLVHALLPAPEPILRARPAAEMPATFVGRLGLWLKENF